MRVTLREFVIPPIEVSRVTVSVEGRGRMAYLRQRRSGCPSSPNNPATYGDFNPWRWVPGALPIAAAQSEDSLGCLPLADFFAALLAPLSNCDALLRRRLA